MKKYNNYIYKKKFKALCDNLINDKTDNNNVDEISLVDLRLNFSVSIFQKIMDFLKY